MRPLLSVVLVPSAPMKDEMPWDGGVGEQDLGDGLLLVGHGLEGDGGGGLGDALDDAGVLGGEEAFGDGDVEDGGEDEGGDGDQQGDGLVLEDEPKGAAVEGDDAFEDVFGVVVEAALLFGRGVAEQAGRHHGGEGEGDEGGDEDGDGEGDGELAEEASGDVAHEEQGDEDGDEGDGEREDGESDLLGAFECGLHGAVALFDVARDVFDHDDGVVDDEAGRDGERHHGEVVEAVACEVHDAEGADERDGHGDGRDDGGGDAAQEEEDDHDDETDAEQQLELDVFDRGADGGGAVGGDLDVDGLGEGGFELRQERGDLVDDLDGVGAGLPLDVEDDGGGGVVPGGELGVFDAVDDLGDAREHDRGAVSIGNDDLFVLVAGGQLIVGVDGVVLACAVEAAFCRVETVAGECVAEVFEVDAVGGKGGGVGLDADGGFLSAGDADEADAGDLGDLGGEAGVGEVFDLREGHLVRGEREGKDGCVGGVGLAVDGGRWQVGGQEALGGVDGGLHLLLGDVDVECELELHDDDRDAAGAGGGHLAESGDLAELAFERRGDSGGDDVGAGSGVEGEDLDGGVVDLGQGRDRQLEVGDGAGQEDRHHEQRGCDRAEDEWFGWIHGAVLPPG